jgi:Tfp pilus assembly protein PilO
MKTHVRWGSWGLSLAMALLAVGYLMFFYLPARQAISQATGQLEEREQVVGQAAGLAGALEVAEQEAAKVDQFVTGWEADCPRTEELSRFYGEIYAVAEAAGARVTRFDPGAIERAERLVKIPLKVGCRGGFGQVFAFLWGLERLRYDVWINELRMESGAENGKDVVCELSLVTFAGNSEKSDYVEKTD